MSSRKHTLIIWDANKSFITLIRRMNGVIFVLLSWLVAMSYPMASLVNRVDSLSPSLQTDFNRGRWLVSAAANKTKQLLLKGWKNRKHHHHHQSYSFNKDEEDLAELLRFKVANSSNQHQTIESSMTSINDEQLSYGNLTCSSSSFICNPTNYLTSLYNYSTSIRTIAVGNTQTTVLLVDKLIVSTCSASSKCLTVVSSVLTSCGRSCTTFTALTVDYYTSYYWVTSSNFILGSSATFSTYDRSSTSSSARVYRTGCILLSAACIAPTLIPAGVAAVGAAAAIAVGRAGLLATVQDSNNDQQTAQQLQQQVETFLASNGQGGAGGIASTPFNLLPIPVPGHSFRNDGGCSDDSILYPVDGRCYPVLKRGPCLGRHQWLTVDPLTLKGRCSPRLCGKGRVFVGRDGLCHDADDPFECGRGGRKLFYTAYGDPICDCPTGHFPFPGPHDDCVALFTRGPCPLGEIVTINNVTGALVCSHDICSSKNSIINRRQQHQSIIDGQLQLIPADDGLCYPLGSSGPCPIASIFHYDIFKLKSVCVNVLSSNAADSDGLDDENYNQLYPEYDFYRIRFTYHGNNRQKSRDHGINHLIEQKQEAQVLSSLPDKLLNPCRPGEKQGNNFKCTNDAYDKYFMNYLIEMQFFC